MPRQPSAALALLEEDRSVAPIQDKQAQGVAKLAPQLVQDATDLVVVIPQDATVEEKLALYNEGLTVAQQMLGYIATAKKQIVERKNFVVKPLKAQTTRIAAWFDSLAAPFEQAKAIVDPKFLSFKNERGRIVLAEEARLLALQVKAQAKLEKQAEKKGLPAPPPLPPPQLALQVTSVATDFGATGVRKSWKAELVDLSQVPPEYRMEVLNEDKVKDDIKAGVREIPGLRIYQVETTVTRT